MTGPKGTRPEYRYDARVKGLLRRGLKGARALWQLAKSEHASPREIGWAVGVGVFAGCTPAVGLHGGLALAFATVLRLNRLWAFLGSRVSSLVILPWIALSEVELAHRLRTGTWAHLRAETVLHQARGLLVDWLMGTVLVGGALGAVLGLTAYMVALRYRRPGRPGPEADVEPSADRPEV